MLRYDPTAPVGERVISVTTGSGTLDLTDDQGSLLFCTTENQVNGAYGYMPSWEWTIISRP